MHRRGRMAIYANSRIYFMVIGCTFERVSMHVETADNHRRKNALEDEDYSGRIIQKKNLSTNVRTPPFVMRKSAKSGICGQFQPCLIGMPAPLYDFPRAIVQDGWLCRYVSYRILQAMPLNNWFELSRTKPINYQILWILRLSIPRRRICRSLTQPCGSLAHHKQ